MDNVPHGGGGGAAISSTTVTHDKINKANLLVVDSLPPHEVAALILAIDGVVNQSGGLQEEAVTLGRHAFVTRKSTERQRV